MEVHHSRLQRRHIGEELSLRRLLVVGLALALIVELRDELRGAGEAEHDAEGLEGQQHTARRGRIAGHLRDLVDGELIELGEG